MTTTPATTDIPGPCSCEIHAGTTDDSAEYRWSGSPGPHTILVAVVVRGESRESAERALHQALPVPSDEHEGAVDSWWIAEDCRHDRSDNDSAVFVAKGNQIPAAALLDHHDYC